MNFDDVMHVVERGPAMSFAEIARELNLSPEGVRLIYAKSIMQVREDMTEEQIEEIKDLFMEESSPYEDMLAAYAISHGQEDLRGFWKESNNYD